MKTKLILLFVVLAATVPASAINLDTVRHKDVIIDYDYPASRPPKPIVSHIRFSWWMLRFYLP